MKSTSQKKFQPTEIMSADDAELASQLAAISAATTVAKAHAQSLALHEEDTALAKELRALGVEMAEQNRLRKKAAVEQDYVTAQKSKLACDAFAEQMAGLRARLAPLAKKRHAAVAKLTELFLADENEPYNRPEPVTVHLVRVISPSSKNFDSSPYFESSDTVQLCVDGEHFESEAHQVAGWAEAHGFIVRRAETEIQL